MNIIKKSLLLAVIITFAAFAQKIEAKNSSEAVENAVAKLQQKVLLSDAQTAEIKSLIQKNVNNLEDSKTLNSTKSSIESILDARQKAKYDIIQNSWWSALVKDVNSPAK